MLSSWPTSTLRPSMTEPFDLVFGTAEVDDLRTDVAAGDEAVDRELALLRDRDLGDLGEVAAVAEVERDARAGPLANFFLPQPAFSAVNFRMLRMRATL
jgi:hypothetical protein